MLLEGSAELGAAAVRMGNCSSSSAKEDEEDEEDDVSVFSTSRITVPDFTGFSL